MTTYRWLMVLSFCLGIYAQNPSVNQCCRQPNQLNGTKCSDGSNITAIHCPAYLIDPTESPYDAYQILENGSLMFQYQQKLEKPGKYCVTKMQKEDGQYVDVALVCFGDQTFQDEYTPGEYVSKGVCAFLSVAFMVATLVIYLLLSELRDLQGKCIMGYVFCLGLAFIILGTLQITTTVGQTECVVLAFTLYFWFMAAFFWLNVVSFNVWKSVMYTKFKISDKALYWIYSSYAWGGSLLFLIVALITHHIPGDHIKPNFGIGVCWFEGPVETWTYFYGPIAVLLAGNTVLFIWTVLRLWNNYQLCIKEKLQFHRYICILYLKLFLIMGLFWIFEILSYVTRDGGKYFWVVTDYINALQGVLIFLILIVFRKRVRKGLAQRGMCGLPRSWAVEDDEECEVLQEEEAGLSQIEPVTLPK